MLIIFAFSDKKYFFLSFVILYSLLLLLGVLSIGFLVITPQTRSF